MDFKKLLSDADLENITGGKLTDAAEAWVAANKETILKRAGSLSGLADYALNAVRSNAKVFDVADIKEFLSNYGIDVSDLN